MAHKALVLVLEAAEVLAVVANTHKSVAVAFVIKVASIVICVVCLYISREEVSKKLVVLHNLAKKKEKKIANMFEDMTCVAPFSKLRCSEL